MIRDSHDTYVTATPLLYEENGELTLHFGFPTIQSRMLKADPERLILDYTRTMMGFLLFQPKPERIAMIGLGGGSLAKYCCRRLPDSDFTAIELSPEVIALREDFGIPQDNERFRIICADGADFVRCEIESLDVLLVDGFDSGGQPGQLCSAAFYDHCHAALRQGGVLVVNLCADDTGYGSYIGRISDSFHEKTVVVDADDGDNKIVFACKGGRFPLSLSEVAERLRALEAEHPVELDKTAQKILHREKARSGRSRKRR
ncbi:transferase [Propionivibrio sp.]|uniref:spermine/spermidine synthase domain-containing protein n=1 Tax=Propionivibrio sp. TaxID=2212460 RepID=UPI003BF43E56